MLSQGGKVRRPALANLRIDLRTSSGGLSFNLAFRHGDREKAAFAEGVRLQQILLFMFQGPTAAAKRFRARFRSEV